MKIFKYLTPERIDVLKNLKIRFTQPYLFNDPFEMNPSIKSLINNDTLNQIIEENFDEVKDILLKTLNKEYNFKNPIQKKFFILSDILLYTYYTEMKSMEDINNNDFMKKVSNNFLDIYKNDNNIIENLIKKYEELFKRDDFVKENYLNIRNHLSNGIYNLISQNMEEIKKGFFKSLKDKFCVLSLSSKNDNLLMWSHYTEDHKGFVLEFDSDHKFFDQRKSDNDLIDKLKEVKYSFTRPIIEIFSGDIKNPYNYDNFIDSFLMTKSFEWEYEKEFRMIRFSEDKDEVIKSENNEKIYLFNFSPDLLKAIYFGCRANIDFINEICTLVKESPGLSHINVFIAEMDTKEYKLDFVNIE